MKDLPERPKIGSLWYDKFNYLGKHSTPEERRKHPQESARVVKVVAHDLSEGKAIVEVVGGWTTEDWWTLRTGGGTVVGRKTRVSFKAFGKSYRPYTLGKYKS